MLISGWADSLTVGVGLNTKYIYYKKLINNTGNLKVLHFHFFSKKTGIKVVRLDFFRGIPSIKFEH